MERESRIDVDILNTDTVQEHHTHGCLNKLEMVVTFIPPLKYSKNVVCLMLFFIAFFKIQFLRTGKKITHKLN